MSKTKALGILIIIAAICGGVIDFLQGHPVDYSALAERASAGFGLIFVRDGIQKAIDAAKK